MKIITEDCAYVQKKDIVYLNQTDLSIPASIFMEIFGKGITIIDDSNKDEFFKFDDPEEINFFKNISWIVDYNEVKDLSKKEIMALGQSIAQERNKIAREFNEMSQVVKKENFDMVQQCQLLDYKMYSLRDILLFKKGKIKIKFPEEVEGSIDIQKSKNGAKKMIKTIFKKKGQ